MPTRRGQSDDLRGAFYIYANDRVTDVMCSVLEERIWVRTNVTSIRFGIITSLYRMNAKDNRAKKL